MGVIRLEYRVAATHVGKGRIETLGVSTQPHNPYWSYFRHLPPNWDKKNISKRTNVAGRLLENLKLAGEMDLSPLKDDQRASGFVYGANPLQIMYDVTLKLAQDYPFYPFFGKWGGYQPEKEGKRFVFYVENEQDAISVIEKVKTIAQTMGQKLKIEHQFGLTNYADFVKIDSTLRSNVNNPREFAAYLNKLMGFPHFFHEFFAMPEFER
jgi:hypothetical protein